MPGLSKLKSLRKIDFNYFFEAFSGLIYWKIITAIFPLSWYVSKLGEMKAESPAGNFSDMQVIKDISRAIARVEKYFPLSFKCLSQAITAKKMLERRNISSTLYLGLSKKNSKELIAHAWLRAGNFIVTGKKGMQKFTVVNSFS